MQDDKIKDLFASKLSNFEPEVPASVWAGIDQLLSQQPPLDMPDASSQAASSGGKAGTALKAGLVTLGVAASLAAGVFLLNRSGEEPMLEANETVEIPIKQEDVQEALPLQEEVSEATAPSALFAQLSRRQPATAEPVAAQIEESETTHAPAMEAMPQAEEVEEAEVVEETEEAEALVIPQFLKEDIALSLKTKFGGLSSSTSQKGGSLLFSGRDRSEAFGRLLKEENKDYKLTHSQPVSVGFTVAKSLSKDFSLETGLMFTYLSSKITSNSAASIEEKQTFGYLGVPVYINYEFYRLKRAKFYLSLGAMMQKDIFGKYTSSFVFGKDLFDIGAGLPDYDIIYSESQYLKKSISQSNWQFSSHLNVGVMVPVYRRLYFYSQLGGAYYFDAGNEYRTIFSDRKFQLDLNLGLRLDF